MAKFDDIIRFLNEAYSDVPVQTPSVAPKAPVAPVEDEDEDLENPEHEGLESPEQEATEELTGQEDEIQEPKPEELSDEEVLSDDELLADKDSEDLDDDSVFGEDDEVPSEDASGEVRSELGIEPEVADEEEQIGRSPIQNDVEDREEHNARVREKFKAWRDAQRQPKDYGM